MVGGAISVHDIDWICCWTVLGHVEISPVGHLVISTLLVLLAAPSVLVPASPVASASAPAMLAVPPIAIPTAISSVAAVSAAHVAVMPPVPPTATVVPSSIEKQKHANVLKSKMSWSLSAKKLTTFCRMTSVC